MKSPVAITPVYNKPYNIVEWTLHNVCNYDCSFCGSEFKSGSKKWLTLDEYKIAVDRIIEESKSMDKLVWFKITGGEPTLFPKLIELISYIKQLGAYVSMISNGSRTLRWWKELSEANCLDTLMISYHPEQCNNPQHVINVANLFNSTSTFVYYSITTIPEYFDAATMAHNKILEECNTITSSLALIIDNQGPNKYSSIQLEKIKNTSIIKSKKWDFTNKWKNIPKDCWYGTSEIDVLYDDGSEKVVHGAYLLKNQQNNYKNWKCNIGINVIKIIHDTVYRGVCQSGIPKNIFTNSVFYNNSIICSHESCNCVLDITVEKIKNYE